LAGPRASAQISQCARRDRGGKSASAKSVLATRPHPCARLGKPITAPARQKRAFGLCPVRLSAIWCGAGNRA